MPVLSAGAEYDYYLPADPQLDPAPRFSLPDFLDGFFDPDPNLRRNVPVTKPPPNNVLPKQQQPYNTYGTNTHPSVAGNGEESIPLRTSARDPGKDDIWWIIILGILVIGSLAIANSGKKKGGKK